MAQHCADFGRTQAESDARRFKLYHYPRPPNLQTFNRFVLRGAFMTIEIVV
jgi:hypothetical protein